MKRAGRIAFVCLVAAGAVVGCGGDDDGGDASDGGDGNTLTISQREYGFDVEGAVVAGTVTVDITNDGSELHEVTLSRLQDGKSIDDVEAAIEAGDEDDPEILLDGIVEKDAAVDALSGVQLPGTSYAISGSGIEAGDYALLCFITDEQGDPHASLGMIAGFTISDGDAGDPPEADVTYTTDGETLEGPDTLEAGETTIHVVNDASGPRELALAKVTDGKTFDDVQAWFDSGFPDVSNAPLDFFTFIFGAEEDRRITVDLTPGEWGIASTAPEQEFGGRFEGVPHALTVTVE